MEIKHLNNCDIDIYIPKHAHVLKPGFWECDYGLKYDSNGIFENLIKELNASIILDLSSKPSDTCYYKSKEIRILENKDEMKALWK